VAILVWHTGEPQHSQWCKSSYSGGGNDCVEVALHPAHAGLRDSKDVAGEALWLSARSWQELRRSAHRPR